MTQCVDSKVLRAHLDRPQAGLDAHLDGCSSCTRLLQSVAADASFTDPFLTSLEPADTEAAADVGPGHGLVPTGIPTPPVVGPPPARRRQRASRRVALWGAVALVLLIVALTPSGRSGVAEALDAFRGERLQVVTVDTATWAASVEAEDLRALAGLGDLDTSGLSEPTEVTDLSEAESVAGIDAPVLAEVPDELIALAPGTVRLVLAARAGNEVPTELDGAALVVDVPGAIGAFYGSAGGAPRFAVGRSGSLMVRAEGASLEAIRSFVLSRQELPPGLRDQLAAISDWRSTIPLPVPREGPGWREVEVAGRPAIAFGDDSGVGALVIRSDPDGVTAVVGRIGVSEALKLVGGA